MSWVEWVAGEWPCDERWLFLTEIGSGRGGASSERERKLAAEKVVERCGRFQFDSEGTRLGFEIAYLSTSYRCGGDGMFMRDICRVEVLVVLKMCWTDGLDDIYTVLFPSLVVNPQRCDDCVR